MKLSTIAALGSLVAALAGCGQANERQGGLAPEARQAQVLSGTARRVALGTLDAAGVADAQRAFGADLLKAVCRKGATGNVTVSPASAALALGQLDAGARGDTRKRIDALLHLPSWSDAVVAAYQAQRVHLATLTQLQVSNHLYSAFGNPPTKQTLDDIETAFASRLAQLDFSDPAATDAINADVNRDTHGLIPTLFDEPLDVTTVAVLTNALHLEADWVTPFDTTTDTAFSTDAGPTVTAHMMSAHEFATPYRSFAGWQSAALPYTGGQLMAYAILPPRGSSCEDVTGATLTALTTGPSREQTDLRMPSVDLAQEHDLLAPLRALGLPVDGVVDYSGLGPQADGISKVIQKVVVKIDQKGTEAAAATGITAFLSARTGPAHSLVLDRPYLLMIQDSKTGTPLFLARIVDPTLR